MKEKVLQWLNRSGINFFLLLVLFVIVAGALFTFYLRSSLHQQDSRKEQAHKVILDLNQMTAYILIGDVGTRGYMLIQEDRFISPLLMAREAYLPKLKEIEEQLALQEYPGLDSLQNIKNDIKAYMDLLSNMHRHAAQGELEAAREILYEDRGLPLITGYMQFRDKAMAFETNILQEATQQAESAINLISYTQWLLLLLGLPTLLLVLYRIKNSEKSRQKLFAELASSNKQYIFDPKTDDGQVDEESVISGIINNLRQVSDFIKAITKGDYSVKWQGINDSNRQANQQNIAGELIQMREQMKQVKEADQRRLWTTEGLSKVAEIARKYQHDVQELSDQLVVNVVRYLDANQAGLFVINDEDHDTKSLDLIACYAYERKKFLRKSIGLGEGLVGQAYLEADTIYMTDLPEDYINITSGLGKAVPRSVLIVPLKFNEEVMGVLEIASLRAIEDYQISFVEDLAEIIASSLSTVRINARTKILLEQSQEQAEQMRSQEEEMRQNMEELQATQEEMQRKTQEYEEIIKRYEATAAQQSEV